MKIGLFIPSLGTGGAERVGVLLANGFRDRGHHVIVYTNLGLRCDYQLQSDVKIVDIGSNNKNKIVKMLYMLRVVRKYVKDDPPEIIIGVMELFSLVAYFSCIGMGIPIIATMHNTFERPSYTPMSRKEKFLKFIINKVFVKVTILTQADKNFIGKRLNNVVVMPNPLVMTPNEAITVRGKIILAAGRLDDWHYKGFDVLIRAWGKVNAKLKMENENIVSGSKFQVSSDGWKLQIAGAGSEKSLNYLNQLCQENGVENSVEFLGFRKDVDKLYQDASIFVLSSRYEGFGLVLIEAMSQGCACIACDYKGRQKEILCPEGQVSSSEFQVSGVEVCENGLLCEPDNIDALSISIEKMMTDSAYRESTRKKAIERSKYYSLENTMNRWENLLKNLIND